MPGNPQCDNLLTSITDNDLTEYPALKPAFDHIKNLDNEDLKVFLTARIIKEANLEGKTDSYIGCAKELNAINEKCDYKLYECYYILKSLYDDNDTVTAAGTGAGAAAAAVPDSSNKLITFLDELFKNFPNISFSSKVFAYLLIYNALENQNVLTTKFKNPLNSIQEFNIRIKDTTMQTNYAAFHNSTNKQTDFNAFKDQILKYFNDNLINKKCTPKSFNEFYHAQVTAATGPLAPAPAAAGPAAAPVKRIKQAIEDDANVGAGGADVYNGHNISDADINILDLIYNNVVPQASGGQGITLTQAEKTDVITIIDNANTHITALKVIWKEFLSKILNTDVVYDGNTNINNEVRDILKAFFDRRTDLNNAATAALPVGTLPPNKILINFDNTTNEITIDTNTYQFNQNYKDRILTDINAIVDNANATFGGYNNKQGNLTYYLCSSSVKISLKKVQAKTAREAAKMVAKKVLKGTKSVKFSLKRMIGKKEKYYNYQASIDKSGKISVETN